MSVKVNALDHLVINVADVARSAEWYRKILGMEVRVFDPGPGPIQFVIGAGRVIPGFEQGIIGMRVGGRRRLTGPPR